MSEGRQPPHHPETTAQRRDSFNVLRSLVFVGSGIALSSLILVALQVTNSPMKS